MASKDDLKSAGYPGVYFREHPTRKLGGKGVRRDRQWVIIQKLGSKRRTSTLGWWSCDEISPGDALNKALEYKANYKWNRGNPEEFPLPICKKDEDALAKAKAAKLEKERKLEEAQNISFGKYFNDTYLPHQVSGGKVSVGREKSLFEEHLEPVLGGLSFKEIQNLHLRHLKKVMSDKKQSPRSIEYALSVFRQVWNLALRDEITNFALPLGKGFMPTVNNEREGFFTYEAEDELLHELKDRSPISCDMLIMSLDTGARWGELARLKWGQVSFEMKTARLLDTKNKSNGTIQIATTRVMEMLKRRKGASASIYVFPARGGGQQKQVNSVIKRAIVKLGFNYGVTDRRFRVSFHSSRHTCASRLAMAGVPLYTIKDIMRHKSISQTERYAHLMPSTTRGALEILNERGIVGA
jgi:integrase